MLDANGKEPPSDARVALWILYRFMLEDESSTMIIGEIVFFEQSIIHILRGDGRVPLCASWLQFATSSFAITSLVTGIASLPTA